MKVVLLFLLLNVVTLNAISQFLPEDMRAGLKGNISYVSTTRYYQYPKGILSRDIQVFDRQGRFIKCIIYDTTKKMQSDFTFQYNKDNRLISYKQYIGKVMQLKVVNIYDAAGRVILQNTYEYKYGYPNSHFDLVKYTFKYDRKGLLIETDDNRYSTDVKPSKIFYKYNIKGQKIIIERRRVDFTPSDKSLLSYNKQGNVIQIVNIDIDQKAPSFSDTTLYEYKDYDKVGNWHQKTEFHISNDVKNAGDITIRKITYFK